MSKKIVEEMEIRGSHIDKHGEKIDVSTVAELLGYEPAQPFTWEKINSLQVYSECLVYKKGTEKHCSEPALFHEFYQEEGRVLARYVCPECGGWTSTSIDNKEIDTSDIPF